jgi:hypothetical protein
MIDDEESNNNQFLLQLVFYKHIYVSFIICLKIEKKKNQSIKKELKNIEKDEFVTREQERSEINITQGFFEYL